MKDQDIPVYEYAVKAEKITDGKTKQIKSRIVISVIGIAAMLMVLILYLMLLTRVRSVAEAALYDRANIFGVIAKEDKRNK